MRLSLSIAITPLPLAASSALMITLMAASHTISESAEKNQVYT
jgi:hypothetical protein